MSFFINTVFSLRIKDERKQLGMAFEHGVDKALIPTVKILGVNIAAINMEWLVNFTLKDIKLSGDYICVTKCSYNSNCI